MGWFNKKKKEDELDASMLPELPDISEFNLQSQLPEVPPGLSNELLSLPPIQPPSLPPIQLPFSQTINPLSSKPVPGGKIIRSKQLPYQKFSPTNYPIKEEFIDGLGIREIGGIKPMTMEMEEPQFESSIHKKIEPLYIRLDKFETIVNSIKEMQNKIREIEELLSRTKEIKIKEEKELEEWEKEIQGIKSRMDFIDKNVFNKLR
ncbi:hypothetical protein J4429_06590 [Candidatus Pacearchaeota archaeon]|nr:hypothetical protein [Candidatus Pacearchaeota archaeon]